MKPQAAPAFDFQDMGDAAQRIADWRADPVLFVKENFGYIKIDGIRSIDPEFGIDVWQLQVLEALPRLGVDPGAQLRVKIAMKACAGPGKSAVLAWVGWWFLTVYGDENDHPKGSCLSSSADNLKTNLWSELSKWQSRSPFLLVMFTQTAEKIFCNDHPMTWFLAAKAFKKDADPETQGRALDGQHSQYTFYLIDETGDMAPAILKKAKQGLTNCTVGLIIIAGNTTSQTGALYHAAVVERTEWFVVTITADPADPNRTPRVDAKMAQHEIDLYGRDNAWVKAYILGEFPAGGINSLISADEVEKALGRVVLVDDYQFVQKRIGIDVARFGDDMTVLFPRQGKAGFMPVSMRHSRTNEIADRAIAGKQRFGAELLFIDATGGFGGGVQDFARMSGVDIIGVNFSSSASDPRFFNKRSEIWWLMCQWVKDGGSLPKECTALVAELSTATYSYQGSKLRVEEKEQIKKRLLKSPDTADALATTFSIPDMPASTINGRPNFMGTNHVSSYDAVGQKTGHQVDYDPYNRM